MVWADRVGDALRFPEDLPIFEDWECGARLAQKGLTAFMGGEMAIQHGHAGPRLSSANELQRATSFLAILSGVWGADSAFLAQHGEAYRQVVRETRCRRIAALLMKYGTREARVEIRL